MGDHNKQNNAERSIEHEFDGLEMWRFLPMAGTKTGFTANKPG